MFLERTQSNNLWLGVGNVPGRASSPLTGGLADTQHLPSMLTGVDKILLQDSAKTKRGRREGDGKKMSRQFATNSLSDKV